MRHRDRNRKRYVDDPPVLPSHHAVETACRDQIYSVDPKR
jgi:hypothetical protein